MKKTITLFTIFSFFWSCQTLKLPKTMSKEQYSHLDDGLYAQMETSKGAMTIKFYQEESPIAVANFIGLSEGTLENKAFPKGKPYYDGLIFHRVIKDFMIQGGDPQGNGSGGPGYQFVNENSPKAKHSKKGILAMANSGPDTNGSQFYITHKATPFLDGGYSVFGEVIEGLTVIDTIATTKTSSDRPVIPITIDKITIMKKGRNFENYDATKAFEAAKAGHEDRKLKIVKEAKEMEEAKLKDFIVGTTETESGLRYKITHEGTGLQAKTGNIVAVHYTGKLLDGTVFDSSYTRNEPISFPLGQGRVIKGWDEGISLMKIGDKAQLIIPPTLGYGAQGAGGVIPPNATLIFDVELVNAK